jgi:hypothetical protein
VETGKTERVKTDVELDREHTYISFQTCLMHNLVQIIRSDASFDFFRSKIENFSAQPTHLPHAVLLLFI